MAVKTKVAGKFSCELLLRQLPHSLVGTQWQPLIKVSGWSTASADPDKGQGQFWWEWMQKHTSMSLICRSSEPLHNCTCTYSAVMPQN